MGSIKKRFKKVKKVTKNFIEELVYRISWYVPAMVLVFATAVVCGITITLVVSATTRDIQSQIASTEELCTCTCTSLDCSEGRSFTPVSYTTDTERIRPHSVSRATVVATKTTVCSETTMVSSATKATTTVKAKTSTTNATTVTTTKAAIITTKAVTTKTDTTKANATASVAWADVDALAQVIEHEAANCSQETKERVAICLLNRTGKNGFASTVQGNKQIPGQYFSGYCPYSETSAQLAQSIMDAYSSGQWSDFCESRGLTTDTVYQRNDYAVSGTNEVYRETGYTSGGYCYTLVYSE